MNSDFEVIHIHKMTHFTDHRGNFLTKTGHKIDDFSIIPHKQYEEKEVDEKQILNALRGGLKKSLTTNVRRRNTLLNRVNMEQSND